MRIQGKRNVHINKLHDKREAQLVCITINLPILLALPLSYSCVNNYIFSLITQFVSYGYSNGNNVLHQVLCHCWKLPCWMTQIHLVTIDVHTLQTFSLAYTLFVISHIHF
jgi:hypothetical protein